MKKSSNSLPVLSEKKLLLKLGQSKYCLRSVDDPPYSHQLELCCKTKAGALRPVASVAADTAQALFSSGMLKQTHGKVILTKAGRSTIKRALALHDGFLSQHRQDASRIMTVNGVTKPLKVNAKESPLFWLSTRKDRAGNPMIEAHQLAAGERLRHDFERAQSQLNGTRGWDRLEFGGKQKKGQRSPGLMITEAMIDAQNRLLKAIEVIGPDLSIVLLDVCCYQLGLADVEKKNGLPKRSGKVILRMGLNQLARHYGLLWDDNVQHNCLRRVTHWGTDDFRPEIDGSSDLD